MSWTNKVSNIIKGQIASHIGNKIMSSFASGGSTKKLAAKLASKSRLDIDKSPTGHLSAQNDPFKYDLLYYPEETTNLGEGHYILFDTIWNTKSLKDGYLNEHTGEHTIATSKFGSVDKKVKILGEPHLKPKNGSVSQIKKNGLASHQVSVPTTGQGAKHQTHKHTGSSIILYTPPTAKYEYKASYEQAETKNLALLAETGGKLFENIKAFVGGVEGSGDTLASLLEAGKVLGRQVLQGALEVTFPGAAGFFTKRTGRALNPRMELAFQSVPFRNFQFEFDFAPKNAKENESVNKIMQLFKFHMLPDVSDEKYMITPSEFQITYYYRDKVNDYMPKISRCVLTDMNIDYAPEGVYHTFKADRVGAMPVITKMTLSFTETEIMTKQTIAAKGM